MRQAIVLAALLVAFTSVDAGATNVTFQGHDPSVFTIMLPGPRGQS